MTDQTLASLIPGPIRAVANSGPVRAAAYDGDGRTGILSQAALDVAAREITTWPGYSPTPLRSLQGLAAAAGLGQILYKDEGRRFGLGSFKALGGAYAVLRLLQEIVRGRTGTTPNSDALSRGDHVDATRGVTVTCATDGNHGRSVAWGARVFGCACVIYVHEGVSQARRDAIAYYGAEIREVPGNYDNAVRQAAADAVRNGWKVVSDTSYPGYTDIPRDVMQGYGLIALEADAQWPDGVLPSHVFVQGGVGGVAASMCSYFWEHHGERAPIFVVVEPDRAACLQLSAEAGRPVATEGALDTIMAGLACGEVSVLAWSILSTGADAFLTVSDQAAAATMRVLAGAPFGDRPIVAGESAVAGLAGALLAAGDPGLREALGLTTKSVVMVIGTEGATDPTLYREIVGREAEAVATSQEIAA